MTNSTVVFITALRLEYEAVVAHLNNQQTQWLAGRDFKSLLAHTN